MRIDFVRDVSLPVGVEEAWSFLNNVTSVVSCLRNVSELRESEDGSYEAVASDKVGPFRIGMDVRLTIDFDEEHRSVQASLHGNDRKTGTRMSGSLAARCTAGENGTSTTAIVARGEVLGPVATLGAGPIRRRMDDVFEEFVACVEAKFASGGEA